jgi:hypothetical protein
VNPIISVVRRYPLAIFVALAYLFSWAPMVFPVIEFPIGFGPFLAALVVLGLTVGRPGVKTLLGRMVRWRVGWRWWLVALGLPILLSGLASYLTVLLGAPAPSAEQLGAWPEVLVTFLIMLIVPGLGGAWEEPGWRGYALHRLEAGRSRLWALPPLWAIIVLWHLPLFVNGGIEWADVFNMVGGVVVYNWLYHRSGHSVLLVMVIHSMNNAASGEFFSPMFTGVYSVQQAWMRTLVWGVVAAIVLIANWRWWTETDRTTVGEPTPVLKPA